MCSPSRADSGETKDRRIVKSVLYMRIVSFLLRFQQDCKEWRAPRGFLKSLSHVATLYARALIISEMLILASHFNRKNLCRVGNFRLAL